jgi:hypothetical protein
LPAIIAIVIVPSIHTSISRSSAVVISISIPLHAQHTPAASSPSSYTDEQARPGFGPLPLFFPINQSIVNCPICHSLVYPDPFSAPSPRLYSVRPSIQRTLQLTTTHLLSTPSFSSSFSRAQKIRRSDQ